MFQAVPTSRDVPTLGPAAAGLPACPLCGRVEWSEPRKGTRLRSCGGCGSFLNDRSSSRQEEEAQYEHCASTVIRDEDPVAGSQWDWVCRGVLGRTHGEGLSVLDIGCGKGAFLAAAQAGGARVHGLELDPAGVEICRRRGLEVTHGSLFDLGLPPGPWHVITFWDVLDHLDDPRGALALASRALAPDGVLVVRGRNAGVHAPLKVGYARSRGFLTRAGIPDLSVVHRWGWGPRGWLALLEHAGLAVTSLHPGIPTPGDRYGTLGPRLLSAPLKALVRGTGSLAFALSGGRLYPFPSVLATGRKANPSESGG